jgi:hypothetical protein
MTVPVLGQFENGPQGIFVFLSDQHSAVAGSPKGAEGFGPGGRDSHDGSPPTNLEQYPSIFS